MELIVCGAVVAMSIIMGLSRVFAKVSVRGARVVFAVCVTPTLIFEGIAFYDVIMAWSTNDKRYAFADMGMGIATMINLMWFAIVAAAYALGRRSSD